MTPILAFDIETVPDVAGLRLLHGIDAQVSDRDVAEFAFRERRARTGHDFLPLHQHRVVAIACALRDEDSFRCWSLGSAEESEAELIRRFFDGIEKYTPQLVSWNGGGFDLPVLQYRSLIHGVSAPRYWEQGDEDRDFRYNNYLARYHMRHVDLMDILSLYQNIMFFYRYCFDYTGTGSGGWWPGWAWSGPRRFFDNFQAIMACVAMSCCIVWHRSLWVRVTHLAVNRAHTGTVSLRQFDPDTDQKLRKSRIFIKNI